MARFVYAVPFALTFALAACGSNSSSNTTDAPVIKTTDAPPPDAAPPDAFSCAAPLKECTAMACADTSNDEANCSECGMACKGGESCTASKCACPTPNNFLPGSIAPGAGLQFIQQGFALSTVTGANGTNGLVSNLGTATTGQEYTLSGPAGGGQPPTPWFAALYGVDIANKSTDSFYVATAGTVKFTALCASEAKGTLTDVTFSGATGNPLGGSITIDPTGCTFTVAKLDFDIITVGGAACQ
jgi:hypothetical protein